MTKTNRVAVIGLLVVVVGLGIFYFAQPACACMTPDQAARAFTRTEMHKVLTAVQTWRGEHGRYPETLEELDWYVDTTLVRVRLTAVAESSLTLVGTSARWTEITCRLDVTPAVQGMETMVCSE